jgi:hypothetical protein
MIKTIKTRVSTATLGAALLAAMLCGAARADQRDFEFVNMHRSASIIAAWSAPAGTSDPWQSITLYYPIGPLSKSRIVVDGGRNCVFDLKVRFDDGYVQTFSNVDLCRIGRVIAS